MKTSTSSQSSNQEQLFLAALTAARAEKNTADHGSALAKYKLGVMLALMRKRGFLDLPVRSAFCAAG